MSREQALTCISDELRDSSARLRKLGFTVNLATAARVTETKLLARRDSIEMKVEVNIVLRGVVSPTTHRPLAPRAQEVLQAEVDVPVASLEDVYAGKLVAALDRISLDFQGAFKGMTSEAIELEQLLDTRERLINDLRQNLDADERRFLLSLVNAAPEWPLLSVPHAEQLPALRTSASAEAGKNDAVFGTTSALGSPSLEKNRRAPNLWAPPAGRFSKP